MFHDFTRHIGTVGCAHGHAAHNNHSNSITCLPTRCLCGFSSQQTYPGVMIVSPYFIQPVVILIMHEYAYAINITLN